MPGPEAVEQIDERDTFGPNTQLEALKAYAIVEDKKLKKLDDTYQSWKKTHEVASKILDLQAELANDKGYRSAKAQDLVNDINRMSEDNVISLPIGPNAKLSKEQVQVLKETMRAQYEKVTGLMSDHSQNVKFIMEQLNMLVELFSKMRTEIDTILANMRKS